MLKFKDRVNIQFLTSVIYIIPFSVMVVGIFYSEIHKTLLRQPASSEVSPLALESMQQARQLKGQPILTKGLRNISQGDLSFPVEGGELFLFNQDLDLIGHTQTEKIIISFCEKEKSNQLASAEREYFLSLLKGHFTSTSFRLFLKLIEQKNFSFII